MTRQIIPPTPEEDTAITAAANAEPDARPFSDFEWEQVKPHVSRGSDWPRIQREAAQDAPLSVDAKSEPYDPSDEAAVAFYWAEAMIKRGQ